MVCCGFNKGAARMTDKLVGDFGEFSLFSQTLLRVREEVATCDWGWSLRKG